MVVCNPRQLKEKLEPNQSILGLDLGTKKIGVAISDVLHTIASPMTMIERTKFANDMCKIKIIINERNVGGIIIGLPVEMDGGEGKRCQATRAFGDNLINHVYKPVAYWDERLSTAAVQRMFIKEANLSRKRRSYLVDKAAAAYILQGALDALADD